MTTPVAITITRREYAELLTCDPVETPAAGNVAGPTIASLISAGTELGFFYQGTHFSVRPGYASVFRIEKVGEGVEGLSVGDVVLAMGEHRSYQEHPAADVWPVPAGLSAFDATFARLMGVSMSTLTTATARPPDRVAVAGLGPVGNLAAQIFQSCGYRVLAFDPDAARRELAQRTGVADVRAAAPLDDPAWVGEVALVLECSGHEQAALDACRLVRKRGEVVLVGVPWHRRTELSAYELLHAVFHRYAVVRSGWEWELPRRPADFRTGNIEGNITAALEWLRSGRVRVADSYALYSPQDCQQAYQALLNAREKSLAVVFDWSRLNQ